MTGLMSAQRRRPFHNHAAGHDNEERWLLTYADMITLLMALFMVLFAISSVNVSKYQVLQKSLRAAFSGSVLPGERSILNSGATSGTKPSPNQQEMPPIVAPHPSQTSQQPTLSVGQVLQKLVNSAAAALAAKHEAQELEALKRRLDAYAREHGFATQVQTVIDRRGLVVRVLTDQLLFDSGQATLKPQGLPLLNEVANLLNVDQQHPISVEGNTDTQPIATGQFPSNWELSTVRATTVVRYLISRGVNENRLAATGYAYLHPIASNATPSGRARNRRVEIVLERLYTPSSA